MSARAGASWQTSLADLSLILFMVTAAAVSPGALPAPGGHAVGGKGGAGARQALAAPVAAAAVPSVAVAEPLSVYIALPDAPPLVQWLAQQEPDPRQQLTITARYDAAKARAREAALGEVVRLAREAAAAGIAARIVVEPAGRGEPASQVRAVLAFDAPGDLSGDLSGGPR